MEGGGDCKGECKGWEEGKWGVLLSVMLRDREGVLVFVMGG